MADDRHRYGLLVSASGAIVLAVSVFLPWYGLSITPAGVAMVQHVGDQVAAQFGNAALQGYFSGLHSTLVGLAGHQVAAVSAHDALKNISVVLLIAAGLAIVIAFVALALPQSSSADGHRLSLPVLGLLASLCVAYRIFQPPTGDQAYLALSLREGAWMALIGCAAIIAGGLWTRPLRARSGDDTKLTGVWSELSGWTPEG